MIGMPPSAVGSCCCLFLLTMTCTPAYAPRPGTECALGALDTVPEVNVDRHQPSDFSIGVKYRGVMATADLMK
jgi:hypothetical protein